MTSLQDMQQQVQDVSAPASTVLGIAARYPAPAGSTCHGTEGFWACLSDGCNLPTTVPLARWDIDTRYAPDLQPACMCASSFE